MNSSASLPGYAKLFEQYGHAVHLASLWNKRASNLAKLLPSLGDCSETVAQESDCSVNKPFVLASAIYRERLTTGIYTRIARELGLKRNGRSHVRRVARGERQSPRVQEALRNELSRIDREVSKFNRKRAA